MTVRRTWLVPVGVAAALIAPLAVAAVSLRRPEWFPVLDLAMTELRVRDVGGSHTPLIGLPGRIGNFPDQGSHPGPLSFYSLAPVYRALGSTSWALLVSTLLVNSLALLAAIAIAYRRGGWRLALALGLLLALLVRGYGIDTVSEPWNPYLPLLWWVVALLAVWSVLCRDLPLLPLAVAAASMCAQTHVPYLGLSLGLGVVVVAALAGHWRRAAEPDVRRAILRWAGVAAAVGVLLWLPPVIDQATKDPGNFSMLWDHFTTPPEEPVGLGRGARLLLLHLDAWSFVTGGTPAAGSLVRASSDPDGSVAAGLVLLFVWLAAAATAWRLRGNDREGRALVSLHAVVAVGLLLGAFSMGRIFGKVWYYLMLWAWAATALLLLAVAWTVVRAVSRFRPVTAPRFAAAAPTALGIAVVAVSAVLVGRAADVPPPAPRLSATLGELVGPTADALDDSTGAATGREGRYVVRWSDAFYIGSQGYGLVSELERRGFEVGVPEPWRVPVTAHRVLAPEVATAQIHMVTGFWIDRWQAVPGAIEVARHEPRTRAQRAEFERVRRRVLRDLEAAGLDDVVPLVDGNLFGATLDPRLPDSTRERMERMLHLGLPAAVFIAPPGVDA